VDGKVLREPSLFLPCGVARQFIQVPPGEYVWTADKPGVAFSQVMMKCRPGVLVNASPPWGLQAQ